VADLAEDFASACSSSLEFRIRSFFLAGLFEDAVDLAQEDVEEASSESFSEELWSLEDFFAPMLSSESCMWEVFGLTEVSWLSSSDETIRFLAG